MKSVAPRPPTHDVYPLRTVAAMTSLTPDLIRAWEKRYAVVAPIRGARGARLYTAADIAHLRLLAQVVAGGRAIGDIAALAPAELERLAAPRAPAGRTRDAGDGARPAQATAVERVLERLRHFDQAAVARLLGDAVVGLGTQSFVHEVAEPLVHEVGERWAAGELSIAEEHLLTAALRNLLAGLLQERRHGGRPLVLATPAGERHELGVLLVALLACEAGASVVYLGVDLPAAQIAAAARRVRACVVGLSLVAECNRTPAVHAVAELHSALPADVELWLGGADAARVAACVHSRRSRVLDTLRATEAELTRLARQGLGP